MPATHGSVASRGWHDASVDDDLLWVTIVKARYSGTYEPGPWLAFTAHPASL